MPHQYRLPDGFTVAARGEADSTWNGFPVPILDRDAYDALRAHIVWRNDGNVLYSAAFVDDGKATPGYYCDGLQWEPLPAFA